MAPRKSSKKSSVSSKPKVGKAAKSYDHDIPAPNVILTALETRGVPTSFAALAKTFDLRDENARKGLKKQLGKMVTRGQLLQNRRDEYCLLNKIDAITGKVSAHRDGFGFLLPDEGGGDDVFLPPHTMRQLMDGDRVAAVDLDYQRLQQPLALDVAVGAAAVADARAQGGPVELASPLSRRLLSLGREPPCFRLGRPDALAGPGLGSGALQVDALSVLH